jgi:hypothetical protein
MGFCLASKGTLQKRRQRSARRRARSRLSASLIAISPLWRLLCTQAAWSFVIVHDLDNPPARGSFHTEFVADAEAEEEEENSADDGLDGGKHVETS